jgi:phosphoribosylformimino-5-aminoimidazole carboxamide ribotide isomerase
VIIIPAIDILDGKVVRLFKGQYNNAVVYSNNIQDVFKTFEDFGAKRLHIVDLNGAKGDNKRNLDILSDLIMNTPMEIEVGGGIRSIETARALLSSGIDYIILGTIAVKDIFLTMQIIETFPEKVILSVDCIGEELAIDGWQKVSTINIADFLSVYSNMPVESIIYTDISKDGTLEGANINMLEKIAYISPYPVIASGGIKNSDDLKLICKINNVKGSIIGKAYYEGKIDLREIIEHYK